MTRRRSECDLEVARVLAISLAAHRKREGLSQEALANLADMHRTEIGRLETGERIPSFYTAFKLAGSLGISLPELTGNVEWVPAKDPDDPDDCGHWSLA